MWHYFCHPGYLSHMTTKLFYQSTSPGLQKLKFKRFRDLGIRNCFIDENLF